MKNFLMIAVMFVSVAAQADGCFQEDAKYRPSMERNYKTAISNLSSETVDLAFRRFGIENLTNEEFTQFANKCSRMKGYCGNIAFMDTTSLCQTLRAQTGDDEYTQAYRTIVNIRSEEQMQMFLPR